MKEQSEQLKLNEMLAKQLKDLTDQTFRLENQHKRLSRGLGHVAFAQPKIIQFPGPKSVSSHTTGYGANSEVRPLNFSIFQAEPGKPLPFEIPDFRPELQRNGLILLGWDWRITESGGVYTAYWVTSAGTARYYASKPLSLDNFYSARPDHKSYAAEDGIEFYGQDSPVYMVHVAPELMMSNPRHGELRKEHIKALKRLGSKVDFSYKYLLKTEKKRKAISKNHQAG